VTDGKGILVRHLEATRLKSPSMMAKGIVDFVKYLRPGGVFDRFKDTSRLGGKEKQISNEQVTPTDG
jgi:hypothetical protein